VFSCVVLCHTSSYACDACGCSASNMGIGLLTDFRSNFIRLGYFDTRFNSSTEHEYITSDRFVQYDLSLRYAFGKAKRMRLMAHLPYGVNIRNSEEEQLSEKGVSDFRLNLNYVVLNNILLGNKFNLYLEAGGGLSLPSGKFDEQIHDRNLPENFNLGKGAIGYIFQINTVFSINKFGMVFSNNYQLNGRTKSDYHYGNQLNTQLNFFREVQVTNFKLIPNVGLGFEDIAKDNYANGKEVAGTGGNGIFLSSAINFKTKKWLAGCAYTIPLKENYSEGEVTAKARLAFQVSYIF